MATDVSPILGLTLVEWVEIAALFSILATCLLASVIRYNTVQSLDKQRKWEEHQTKLDSARLVVELDKVFREAKFRWVMELMYYHSINLEDDEQRNWFHRYINHANFVYKLYFSGLIDKSDILVYSGIPALLRGKKSAETFVRKRRKSLTYLNRYMDLTPSR